MVNAKAVYSASLVWTALMVGLSRGRWLTNVRDFITSRTHKGGAS